MEDYPVPYTEHNLPLILLSGLGAAEGDSQASQSVPPFRQESGTKIVFDSPECHGERARLLLQQFSSFDGSQKPWNSTSLPGPAGSLKYKFKTTGRTYTLPSRKAAPLPQSPTSEGIPTRQANSNELHSRLSPLSPGSPIFPDGVFTPLWFSKHQKQVPAVIIAFFDFNADGSPAEDDLVKADINSVRASLGRSGFRTRLAAVLTSNASIIQRPELEDRISGIRRATTLDAKTGLFFMPPMTSSGEVTSFIQSILTTLQPLCVEYYRDLTKHARRKKTRSSVPMTPSMPMLGASQSLSTPGWNARYETKQGVFAEFRQEMDVAERHYSQALDELFNAEGTFETTPSWSPRWDDTRLIADTLAIRIIRCHLWNGMTTTAAQVWVDYRIRMRSLVDRRGKGTDTYSWDAWEFRWAKTMSQLIRYAEIPNFVSSLKQSVEGSTDLTSLNTFAPPDKAFQIVQRVPPFLLLHHPGYWDRIALKSARLRRQKALAIPEEDRVPPGQSPASSVALRSQKYDTYLVSEPHAEFASAESLDWADQLHLAGTTEHACREFSNKGQTRMTEQMRLELAKDYHSAGLHQKALEVLIPLWTDSTWRGEQWDALFTDLLTVLSQSAKAVGNRDLLLSATWELMRVNSKLQDGLDTDIAQCLKSVDDESSAKSTLAFENSERLSPIALQFAFSSREAFVGEPLKCQLLIQSHARQGTAPITLSEIRLAIASLNDIRLRQDSNSNDLRFCEVALNDDQGSLSGVANLTFKPGERRVLQLTLIFRDATMIRINEVSATIDGDHFHITQTINDHEVLASPLWYGPLQNGLTEETIHREDSTLVAVHPKPPKVEIALGKLRQHYYVGEEVQVGVEFINNEAEAVNGIISHRAITQEGETVLQSQLQRNDVAEISVATSDQPSFQNVEALAPSAKLRTVLRMKAPEEPIKCSLTIDLNYTLVSEPRTTLQKSIVVTVPFLTLFEAKFSFGPLLYPEPWPSYFDTTSRETSEDPAGIPQSWKANTQLRSTATEAITMKGTELIVDEVATDAACKILDSEKLPAEVTDANKTMERNFELVTQKFSLDDRRPIILDLSLAVSWSHESNSEVFTTNIVMPRLTIPSSEPRVLCTATIPGTFEADATLHYHLENPSTHFLTFALTMGASEEFAFSGSKYKTLSLAPLSRLCVDYALVLHMKDATSHAATNDGRWIRPNLQVVDSYYQKTLRVQAAGPNVKAEAQKGLAIWVPSKQE